MDIIIDKIENSEALIKIKLKEDDYQPRVTQKIKDFSKKANIKGFRQGKVPPGMIKKMYGNSFLVEEINKIVSDELNKILKENDIQFLGEPMPHDDQQSIDWDNQKEFEFVFNIGYTDEFELKIDKKVKVDFNKIKVDESIINETVDNLRNQFGEISNPEIVGNGDTILGSLKSADESFNQEVTIDLKELDKGILRKVLGAKLEDTIQLDIKKSFKDKDYFKRISNIGDEELKNIEKNLTLTIKGINHTTPTEIGQDLYDKTFGKDTVKSEQEFRIKIRETISKNYNAESLNFFNHKVQEKLVETSKIVLPNLFLKKWLLKTNDNITEDILDKEYEHYSKELKWSLIRNKITKDHQLKVEHEDVVKQAKDLIAQQFGGGDIAEKLGDQMNTFADNYLKGENGENYMKVYNQVQNEKVFKFIEDNITTKEKEISLNEFKKL